MRRFAALWIAGVVLSCNAPPSSVEVGDGNDRRLTLAHPFGELIIKVKLNNADLTDPAIASQLKVVATAETDNDEYQGNDNNKTVKRNPNLDTTADVFTCSGDACGHSFFQDRWDTGDASGGNIGEIAGGNYTVRLQKKSDSSTISTAFIAMNHPNASSGNGTFLDISADQTVTFFINSSLNQTAIPQYTAAHTRSEPHLRDSIIRPSASDTTIFVNQVLSVQGQASNGLTCCAKKFAWDWNASNSNTETFDTEFSTSSTANVSYSTAGPKKIRLIARDGNDNASTPPRGGQYAMSTVKTVTVEAGDAQAVSNTIPDEVTTGVFYATSVTMKNTGPNTWTSGAGFKLGQAANGTWLPIQVNLPNSVAPNNNVTFNFNLKHVEPEVLGNNACFWQMKLSSSFFGDQNQKTVWVNGSGFSFNESLLHRLITAFLPVIAHAETISGVFGQQAEVVQVVRSVDERLNVREIEASGKHVLRYEASLAEEWTVDYYFYVKFDEKAFTVGEVTQGPRGVNHEIEVSSPAPGEVIIKASRTGMRGLSGFGLILEVPFILRPGAQAPETLALVELVATK